MALRAEDVQTFYMQKSNILKSAGMNAAGMFPESDFSRSLHPVGRILDLPDWYVWCASPVIGEDGKFHVFFSRWPKGDDGDLGFRRWRIDSEIAHAVADRPEGPYRILGTILKGRPGEWDSLSIHNPSVVRANGRYYLFYMGNALPPSGDRTDGAGLLREKKIGVAVADSVYGPWQERKLLLERSENPEAFDGLLVSNPSCVIAPDGSSTLFYKGHPDRVGDLHAHERQERGMPVTFNLQYGVAYAPSPLGPYTRHSGNPIFNFGDRSAHVEDACVFIENGTWNWLSRDMGQFGHTGGLHMTSSNGLDWSEPQIGFKGLFDYFDEPRLGLHREGALERPQVLLQDGRATHVFFASRGGNHRLSTAIVFERRP